MRKIQNNHGLYVISVFFTLITFFSSCVEEETTSVESTRTVLVYLAADNNLGGVAEAKIDSLKKGWTKCGNLLIYADIRGKGATLYKMRGGCSYSEPYLEEVSTYGAENSASAEALSRVLADAKTLYPADEYGLIYFSHASGWLPAGNLANPLVTRSFGIDNGAGTGNLETELADFAQAIPDGGLDFIIFETCLTSGVEVAYALRNKADYLLMSSAEIVDPGFSPTYRTSIVKLFDDNMSVQQCVQNFATDYFHSVNVQTGIYRSATMSLVRTSGMDELATLCREVLANRQVNDTTLNVNEIQRFDRPGKYADSPAVVRYLDFGETMERLATSEQYKAIEAQLSKTVVWEAATPSFLLDANGTEVGYNGFAIRRHSGLTTYVERAQLPALNESYRQTAWYKATR